MVLMKRQFKINLPNTLALFPVEAELSRDNTDKAPVRGVALIIAIMIISIMMMFATDFIVSSTVDLTLATAERDNIKAEYVAKSGANWAMWLNIFDYGLDLQFSSSREPMMQQAKSAVGPLWNKLNEIFPYDAPLDLTQVSTFAKAFGMSGFMDASIIEMLQSLGGELGVGVADEGGKINLNACYQSRTICKTVMMMVNALLTCTDVEQDYMKTANIKPNEIAAKIQDWIDGDQSAEAESGQSSEDDAYQKRKPPHKSKNGPLDTIDELKVVDGWTDELHAYFSPYLTAYPFTYPQDKEKNVFRVNVNSVNQEVLRCFFSRELNSPEAKENFTKKVKEILDKDSQLASDDSSLNGLLKDVIGYQSDAGDKGKESDKSTWLATSSRAFRVQAKGIVGNQTRIIDYVIERQSVAQRKGSSSPGAPWRLDGYFRQ